MMRARAYVLLVPFLLASCRPSDETLARRLREATTPSRISAAEKQLRDKDPASVRPYLVSLALDTRTHIQSRAAAVRLLCDGATPSLPMHAGVLRTVERDGDAAARAVIANALGRCGDPAARNALGQAAASDPDDLVRAAATASLSAREAPARRWYTEVLSSSKDAGERALAARELGAIRGEESVAALFAALSRDADALVRHEVILALGEQGGEAARAAVRALLASPLPHDRAAAASAAIPLADPDAVPELAALFASTDAPDVRVAAGRALAAIGTPASRDALATRCRPLPTPAEVASVCRQTRLSDPSE